MLAFLISLGVLWIVLKVVTLFVELPFRLVTTLFSLPFSILFWVILAACLLLIVYRR